MTVSGRTQGMPQHETLTAGGYALLRGIVSKEVIREIRDEYERGLTGISAQVGRRTEEIEKVATAWNRHCPFVEVAMDKLVPALRHCFNKSSGVANDVGEPIDASIFVMSSSWLDGTPAHQDIAYRWNRSIEDRYAYTTWVALDSCDEETGALCFSDGIPRTPIAPRQDFLRADFVDRASTEEWLHSESVVRAEAGDIVVFDSCTWHASYPYRRNGQRIALAIRWTSAAGWERSLCLPTPEPSPETFGMDTSGRLLVDALFAAYPVLQPTELSQRSVLHTLQALVADHPSFLSQLSADSHAALLDMKFALELSEQYGARPAAHLWRAVRDTVIPELRALPGGEA